MTEIVQLGAMDEQDEQFEEFLGALTKDNARVVYIMEKKDGSVHVGSNSTDRRDLIYDLYRLQDVCRYIVNNGD